MMNILNKTFIFKPEGFLEGLKYLGLGMLGIFIVVAIIAIFTIILVEVFKDRKK